MQKAKKPTQIAYVRPGLAVRHGTIGVTRMDMSIATEKTTF